MAATKEGSRQTEGLVGKKPKRDESALVAYRGKKPKRDESALVAYRDSLPTEITYDAIVGELHGQEDLVDSSILGDGWSVLKEKEQLVGVPFVILDWTFSEGDNGEFVSVRVITNDNRRLVINDGSTGVLAQIRDYADRGHVRAILCRHGLRRSDYEKVVDGRTLKATTFYLDTQG